VISEEVLYSNAPATIQRKIGRNKIKGEIYPIMKTSAGLYILNLINKINR
jgi:hypothetical protein